MEEVLNIKKWRCNTYYVIFPRAISIFFDPVIHSITAINCSRRFIMFLMHSMTANMYDDLQVLLVLALVHGRFR